MGEKASGVREVGASFPHLVEERCLVVCGTFTSFPLSLVSEKNSHNTFVTYSHSSLLLFITFRIIISCNIKFRSASEQRV